MELNTTKFQELFSEFKNNYSSANHFKGFELLNFIVEKLDVDTQKAESFINQHIWTNELFYPFFYNLNNSSVSSIKSSSDYIFAVSVYNSLSKDQKIINLFERETKNHHFDSNINALELSHNLKIILGNIYGRHIDEYKVSYKNIMNDKEFNEDFQEIIYKLAFANLTSLLNSEDQKLTFFINIYNILNLHSRIIWSTRKKSFEVGVLSLMKFFENNKYCIGGLIFSLNDIEHGVLRRNYNRDKIPRPNFIASIFSVSNSRHDRFQINDPRNKLLVQKLDPRIHFALNCGAKSCPPIRVYEHEKLDSQLNKASKSFIQQEVSFKISNGKIILTANKILEWYSKDFGVDNTEKLIYIMQFMKDEDKNQIEKSLDSGSKIEFLYKKYDFSVNSD